MTGWSPPAEAPAPASRGGGPGAAAFRFLVRTLTTRGRLAALLALSIGAVVVGAAGAAAGGMDDADAVDLVDLAGLGLFAPLVALVLASAVLGDHVEDQTLVYLWMRPVRRGTLALVAHAAALLVALPFVVVPLVLMAALVGGGDVVVGAAVTGVLAVIGYTAVFVAVGTLTTRALVWGLVYVLLWEGAIGSVGSTLARTSLRLHLASVLRSVAGLEHESYEVSGAVGAVVVLAVGVLGPLVTAWALRAKDVA